MLTQKSIVLALFLSIIFISPPGSLCEQKNFTDEQLEELIYDAIIITALDNFLDFTQKARNLGKCIRVKLNAEDRTSYLEVGSDYLAASTADNEGMMVVLLTSKSPTHYALSVGFKTGAEETVENYSILLPASSNVITIIFPNEKRMVAKYLTILCQ